MRKKIILFVFVLSFMFLGLNRVYASDINDFKIKVEAETGKVASQLTMKVEGTFEEGYNYYVKFVNQNDAKPNDFSSSSSINTNSNDITKWKNIYATSNGHVVHIQNDWYMLNGYDYAYFLKCDNIYNNCEISDDKLKVERPALPELMKRYNFSTVTNRMHVFPLYPFRGENGSHKRIIKLGLLNDNNILKELRTNKENGLEKLINYAKNNGTEFIDSDTNNDFDATSFNKTIIEGAYYFVYITYENSDGLYRNLEDVIVTDVIQGSTNGYLHALDDLSKLTFEEDEIANSATDKINNETTNPKTSDIKVVYVFVSVLFLAAIILTGIKRIKKRG